MIHVEINKHANGDICSFTLDGHADFNKKGKDIVCAGVSAVVFGTINAIMELTEVEPIVEQGKKGGYLRCIIPDNLPLEINDQVQLLLQGMFVSLQTIEMDYSKYIKITFQ